MGDDLLRLLQHCARLSNRKPAAATSPLRYDWAKLTRPRPRSDFALADPAPVFDLYNLVRSKPHMPHAIIAGYLKSVPAEEIDRKKGKYGRVALHAACKSGNLDAVNVLLAAGANPVVQDTMQYTPLMMAVVADHWVVVARLLQVPAVIDAINTPRLTDHGTALTIALQKVNTSEATPNVLQLLLAQSAADPNVILCSGGTILHDLAKDHQGGAALVMLMSRSDLDVNKLHVVLQCTPLHVAIDGGLTEPTILLLCHRGIKPTIRDAKNQTPQDVLLDVTKGNTSSGTAAMVKKISDLIAVVTPKRA